MKKKLSLVYHYYIFKDSFLPYLKTIITAWIFVLIHFNILNQIFNFTDYIKGSYEYENVLSFQNLCYLAFSILLLLITLCIVKKRDLTKYDFDKIQLIKGWRKLSIYTVSMFIILFMLVYRHKIPHLGS